MSVLDLKIPPVVLVLSAFTAMWALSTATPGFTWQVPYKGTIAFAVAVAGGIVAVLGVRSFQHARTTVNPTRPQDTSSLVTTGIYHVSRNPMYLGFLLLLLAFAVFLANILAVLPVVAFVAYMNRFQITPEERALVARFGPEYDAYKQRVRRWV
jgi:protein-S-isoprenylcysteine O-methyltransferase Ste14